jgi:hypothetical protein
MKPKTLASVFAALCLAGCASMSRNECVTVDWRTVGYEDGAAGRTGDQIGRYRKACAEHGVAPDLDAYQAGRNEGLREYCEPNNGFRVGESGTRYGGPCPADLAPAFNAAYEAGRELYLREYRVDRANAQLASTRVELEQLEQQIVSAGYVVASSTSTPEERTHAFLETKQLAERHERLEAEITRLQRDKRRYERELDEYRTQVAYAN